MQSQRHASADSARSSAQLLDGTLEIRHATLAVRICTRMAQPPHMHMDVPPSPVAEQAPCQHHLCFMHAVSLPDRTAYLHCRADHAGALQPRCSMLQAPPGALQEQQPWQCCLRTAAQQQQP